MTRPRRPRTRRTVLAAVAIALVAACAGQGSTQGGEERAPVATSTTSPSPYPAENAAFTYERIRRPADLEAVGRVALVVASRRQPRTTPARIHATGARAYRYVQTYWYAPGSHYDGLDIADHPDWAFCRRRARPARARRTEGGERLTLLDMNERAVADYFGALLTRLKAEGWDGVFFDRGFAAMTGQDALPADVWNRVSTCTEDPVRPGATFADSYVQLAGMVHEHGLELMINYGLSPFDARAPMRPDPRSPECVDPGASDCPRLDDVWATTDWILSEGLTHPTDMDWKADFAANRANEQDPAHGGHVLGLITDANLGGAHDADSVFFAWSRVKLFAVPLAVGTGTRGCGRRPEGTICNRALAFPQLASITLGRPLDPEPTRQDCARGSTVHCVWVRRYEHGVVVVNVRPERVRTTVTVGPPCRVLYDVHAGRRVSDRCLDAVPLRLPAWSGRPLTDVAP